MSSAMTLSPDLSRERRKLNLYLVSLCLIAIILGELYLLAWQTFSSRFDQRLLAGSFAPGFVLTSSNGQVINLANYRSEIVYLVFMQTACSISDQEMPRLEQWAALHPDVRVLAVYPEAQEVIRAYQQRNRFEHVTFVSDRDREVWSAYGITGTPTAYVIDREGVIRFSRLGGPSRLDQFDLYMQYVDLSQ